MDLRHLRYFIAAAEDENFTRAAERLNVAAPALLRRIRDLEVELGIDLFERRRKRVYLTEAGAAFLHDTRAVLDELDLACQRAQRIGKREKEVLRIGVHAVSM